MTERQYQTLKYAFWGAVVVSLVFAVVGCSFPTTASHTEYEQVFLDCAQCFADQMRLGKTITLKIFENAREHCGDDGRCGIVACAAWPHGSQIECFRGWINDSANVGTFAHVAAHEVCHVSGIWDERAAAACAAEIMAGSECAS